MAAQTGWRLMSDSSTEGAITAEIHVPDDQRFEARRVRSFDIVEELSGGFSAIIDLEGEESGAPASDLLSRSVTIVLSRGESVHRFSGIVRRVDSPSRASLGAGRPFRILIEPGFACLSLARGIARFQDATVPAILRDVLKAGLAPFPGRAIEFRLTRPTAPDQGGRPFAVREHCTQYHESTYDFSRRLLAEEGMSYFYDQTAATETLVMTDDVNGFTDLGAGYALKLDQARAASDVECIYGLRLVRSQTAGAASLRAFDGIDLESINEGRSVSPSAGRGGVLALGRYGQRFDPHPAVTHHGFDGQRYRRSDLEVQTEIRSQGLDTATKVLEGSGSVLSFAPGHLFSMVATPPVGALPVWAAGRFLIVSVRHKGECPPTRSGDHEQSEHHARYSNEFTCIPDNVPFRPALIPRPIATDDLAEVVGLSDDDPIWVDEHGRIRVRFFNHRPDHPDGDGTSAWIPLSQPVVGAGHGVQMIPRAGMAVIVSHMFGDPDRPVISGCLATSHNHLPSPTDDHKSRATLRSRSLREGSKDRLHHNEITMDDAAGSEELFFHAGRDFRRRVLNDERSEIARDDARELQGEQRIRVDAARTQVVRHGESIKVYGHRTTEVGAGDHRIVSIDETDGDGARPLDTERVAVDQVVLVRGARVTDVVLHDAVNVGGGREQLLPGEMGNDKLHVTGMMSVTADNRWKAMQGRTSLDLTDGAAVLKAAGDIEIANSGGRLAMVPEGKTSLEIRSLRAVCGRSQITLEPDGIKIRGDNVLARGRKGTVRIVADGVATTGTDVLASALMVNHIKGPLVIISDAPGSVDSSAATRPNLVASTDQINSLPGQPTKDDPAQLTVTLLGHDLKPAAGATYKMLLPTGEVIEGAADGAGKVSVSVPAATRTVELAYSTEPGAPPIMRTLTLLGKPETTEALAAHLRHLGFGTATDSDRDAIAAFQGSSVLQVTGEAGPGTMAALDRLMAGLPPSEDEE